MDQRLNVAVLVGSLRRGSYNLKLARALARSAPPELALEIVSLEGLPLYNDDLEVDPPQAWLALRNRVRATDALLFITPEYNRSVPAVLKNALDVASRPQGTNVWSGKPGAIITTSPGRIGGFGANHHLRQILVYLNVPTLAQPEAYVDSLAELFDDEGTVVPARAAFFAQFLREFARFAARFGSRERPAIAAQ